jgi:hypothetical protein
MHIIDDGDININNFGGEIEETIKKGKEIMVIAYHALLGFVLYITVYIEIK